MDIRKEIDEVLSKFKSISYDEKKNHLEGDLFVTREDSYEVQIDLNPYPNFFPTVYEIGGRIPKKLDRHIYSDTGSCCLTTRAQSQILLRTKVNSLAVFIKEIVIPYFQNNSFYEINKKYNTGEYSHDKLGVIEGYRDIFLIQDDLIIAKILLNRIQGEKLKLYHNCYCGSGYTLKKCTEGRHEQCYRNFKLIEKNQLRLDLIRYFQPYLREIGLLK